MSQVVPRTVTLSGGGSAVWVLEIRTLSLPPNTPSQLHANLDFRARSMRSVAEWSMTTYSLPERDEAVVQLVIRRQTAARRPDNIFLAWSRVVSGLFKHDDACPQAVAGISYPVRGQVLPVLRRAGGNGSLRRRVPPCR